jgi:hypothetical protein
MFEYSKVSYNGKDYGVISIKYNKSEIPVVVDWKDVKYLKKLNKKWKCHKNGFLSTPHSFNGSNQNIYLHEIIMAQKNHDEGSEFSTKPILHINRLNLDNRRENLVYRDCDIKYKNVKKKKRTISFPEEYGINPSKLPTYVWYMKENGTHGERFMVNVGDIQWKTTASKSISLIEKLDEAKSFLRKLKSSNPELFKNTCMNGEYTEAGKKLSKEYYDIITEAGFDYFIKNKNDGITDKLIS